MDYAIRLARSYSDISGVCDLYKGVCTALVVYEHPNNSREGQHVHMLMMGCTKGSDTLKNYLKRLFGEFRAVDWSFKTSYKSNGETVPVSTDFISYMSKGKYDPVYLYGISADEIALYKAKGYDKNDLRFQDGKFIKPVKESSVKPTYRELVELIMPHVNVDASRRSICAGIKKILAKHGYAIGLYKVRDIYDSVMMYGNEERWLDMMEHLIARRDDN